MLFNSHVFLFAYLPLALVGFFALARVNHRAAAAFLAVASFVFYGWWDYRYVPLLLGSTTFNYVMGCAIARATSQGRRRRAGWLLALAVGADLALLGYFKYTNFLLEASNDLLATHWEWAKIALPIGISFFTFTQIAFLVDAYRGLAREYNPIHYALFVSYFPHLIAGPILHHREMMPQFASAATYRPRWSNFAIGTTIFAIGLFKKVVLADGVAPYANDMFGAASAGAAPTFVEAWGGALAYTLQLYFDFSGYCDMAIGLSRMFGVRLPLNFNSPYKAKSIVDFWRRWHMTLSRFLRDYLYVPLGGNRRGKARTYLNLFLTMLLGGIWHGAGWTFVLWGALHGAYLVANHAWVQLRLAARWQPGGRAWTVLSWLATFVAVVVGWVFFRATDVESALAILRGMAGAHGVVLPEAWRALLPAPVGGVLSSLGIVFGSTGTFRGLSQVAETAALLATCVLLPNTQQLMRRYRPGFEPVRAEHGPASLLAWRPTLPWALGVVALLLLAVTQMTRPSEFLYFNF